MTSSQITKLNIIICFNQRTSFPVLYAFKLSVFSDLFMFAEIHLPAHKNTLLAIKGKHFVIQELENESNEKYFWEF